MFQELQIFAFVCTYSDAGCLFKLCGSDFGIIIIIITIIERKVIGSSKY
jgi:hypothetical protein